MPASLNCRQSQSSLREGVSAIAQQIMRLRRDGKQDFSSSWVLWSVHLSGCEELDVWRVGSAHDSEVSRTFIPAFSGIQEQLTNSSAGSWCCQKTMHNSGRKFQRVFVAQAVIIFYNPYATGTFLSSFRFSSRPAEVFVSIITVWMGSGSWPSLLKSFCSDRWGS